VIAQEFRIHRLELDAASASGARQFDRGPGFQMLIEVRAEEEEKKKHSKDEKASE
jgi:hypothetical protein